MLSTFSVVYGDTEVTCVCVFLSRAHDIVSRANDLVSRAHDINKKHTHVTFVSPYVIPVRRMRYCRYRVAYHELSYVTIVTICNFRNKTFDLVVHLVSMNKQCCWRECYFCSSAPMCVNVLCMFPLLSFVLCLYSCLFVSIMVLVISLVCVYLEM